MFERVLQLAMVGAKAIYNILKEAVQNHANELLSK